MNGKPLPTWQLPTGVSRGTWDYLQSEHIAGDYDEYFADSALMRLDMQVLRQRLPAVSPDGKLGGEPQRPCVIADLGCGTGRVAYELLPLGYHMLNVDLSPAMLREVEAKTPVEFRHRSRCLSANLVEIDQVLEAGSLDWAVCLFSSLGMIRGRQHRRRFLSGVHQALKPGGTFFVHVHNRYRSLLDPGGPSWLARSWLTSRWDKNTEFGDRVYSYRRLPRMFLHIYSRRELRQDLHSAGLRNISVQPIDPTGSELLPPSWLPRPIRAGGYFAFASRNPACR